MRKTIKFVPIYRGELNMTPNRYHEIKDADRKIRYKFQRAMHFVESLILVVSSGYIVASVIVGFIR